jgi:membrane AbrB-like protein
LLGSFPGGLATVLVLAVENNADVRAIAVVQTVRVVAIAVLLPAAIAASGFVADPAPPKASAFAAPMQIVALVVVSTAAALGAHRLRMPGGLIFGSMISSAILHGTGLITVTLPPWLAILAFVVLGALTGTRFSNMDVRMLRHLAAAAFGALVVSVGVATACAVTAAWILTMDHGPMVIAYAPGAIDAMMVLALALNYDAAFVGAHHLARFMLVLITMPAIVGIMRRMRRPRDEKPPS